MNTKTKTFAMFLLGAILVAGTISMTIPKSFAFSFGDSYAKDYKKHESNVNIQKAKCNNIIINGVEKSRPTSGDMTGNAMADEANDGVGQLQSQGLENDEKKFKGFDRNIVNHCINKHNILAVAEQNGLNVGSLYIVEGPVVSNQPSNPTESIASCDAGDFVISGGFNLNNLSALLDDWDSVKSVPTTTLDGWSASFQSNVGNTNPEIQATAVCFDAQ